MAYYDRIAKQWHDATGHKGGPFKKLVLNDILLASIPAIEACSILEIGAGNGYFLPLLLRRYSGQLPSSIVITDKSEQMLDIAWKHFRVQGATYEVLDAGRRFPFEPASFDLILATMVFNELTSNDLEQALGECHRVLTENGLLLSTVTHPDFIRNLQRKGLLTRSHDGLLTMPGSGTLRLPVVIRSAAQYRRAFAEAGFEFQEQDVSPSLEVLRARPGLRNARGLPLALVFKCRKRGADGSPGQQGE